MLTVCSSLPSISRKQQPGCERKRNQGVDIKLKSVLVLVRKFRVAQVRGKPVQRGGPLHQRMDPRSFAQRAAAKTDESAKQGDPEVTPFAFVERHGRLNLRGKVPIHNYCRQ
jgi:hypothetical protein